jgi:hypothetical protein
VPIAELKLQNSLVQNRLESGPTARLMGKSPGATEKDGKEGTVADGSSSFVGGHSSSSSPEGEGPDRSASLGVAGGGVAPLYTPPHMGGGGHLAGGVLQNKKSSPKLSPMHATLQPIKRPAEVNVSSPAGGGLGMPASSSSAASAAAASPPAAVREDLQAVGQFLSGHGTAGRDLPPSKGGGGGEGGGLGGAAAAALSAKVDTLAVQMEAMQQAMQEILQRLPPKQ